MNRTTFVATIAVTLLLAPTDRAGAQIREPQLGVSGGATVPIGGFKEETGIGWNAGGLLKVRVWKAFDLRVDGLYSKLGSRNLEFANATVNSESNLTVASLLLELNLGPDSAQYPGDNHISPYINGGPAWYRYEFEGVCTGDCTGFAQEGEETKIGFNAGFGANVPYRGFPLFAELRYHRFSTLYPVTQVNATATLLTVSAGFKIR